MDYPFQITSSANGFVAVIRLRVAALIACLDHGCIGKIRYSEEEVNDFCAEEKIDSETGIKMESGWLSPHAFAFIQARGNLQIAEDKILTELIASIKNREFKPIHLLMSLDGDVDVYDTWITLTDFSNWCDTRQIDLGDLYNNYSNNEDNIVEAAVYSGNVARSRFETPNFDARFNIRVATEIKQNFVTVDQYRDLLTENIVLSEAASYPVDRREEKPIQARERNTLLAIIAALCKEANLDHTKHAKTASIIKKTAERMGLTIGETTIEGKLKAIQNAVEIRTR